MSVGHTGRPMAQVAGRARLGLLIVITSMAVGGGIASAEGVQNKPGNPVPMSEDSVKAGRAVYATWCRSCHGLRGRGDGVTAPEGAKPANLTDAEWKYGATDAEIFNNIRKGIKPFTAMKPQPDTLKDTDIWSVVNFIRSLSAPAKP